MKIQKVFLKSNDKKHIFQIVVWAKKNLGEQFPLPTCLNILFLMTIFKHVSYMFYDLFFFYFFFSEGSVETSSVLPMTFVMPNITKVCQVYFFCLGIAAVKAIWYHRWIISRVKRFTCVVARIFVCPWKWWTLASMISLSPKFLEFIRDSFDLSEKQCRSICPLKLTKIIFNLDIQPLHAKYFSV